MHSLNAMHKTCAAEGVTTMRDATSAMKDQGQKRSEATCAMHIF
jgi:hypothetical protein